MWRGIKFSMNGGPQENIQERKYLYSVDGCEWCGSKFGKGVYDIEIVNWDPSKVKGSIIGATVHICGFCYQIWSEIFETNFGKSVQQPDYEKCFNLFTKFMKEGDIFVLS